MNVLRVLQQNVMSPLHDSAYARIITVSTDKVVLRHCLAPEEK